MPGHAQVEFTRHYSALSEKEADAVVGMVADLIVTYLKKQSRTNSPVSLGAEAIRDDGTEAQEVRP